MGIYDGFGDTPNQIRSEGQNIDVAFIRNGDGTGTIKWNIPPPVAGCSVEDQAYDGIVIIVSDKPANYIESSPKDGVYYNGDPTFDTDLHTGDTIDGARVVGAFYHDKTTTTLVVQDVKERTPYYVSAYAVDGVGRYHREGVHAYSLPTGFEEYNASSDTPAMQDIGLDVNPINNGTLTGLQSGVDYQFKIKINNIEYTVNIEGHDALTYPDLVDAINRQFVLLTPAERKDLNNCGGQFYFDTENNVLYKWDYDKYVEVPVLINDNDPTLPILGTYWYNGEELFVYETAGWVSVPLLTLSFDPTQPECGTVWFDGVTAWMWEKTKWCELETYVQERNPLLPPIMSCDNYWYDETEFELKKWAEDINGWKVVDVIYASSDPNTLTFSVAIFLTVDPASGAIMTSTNSWLNG